MGLILKRDDIVSFLKENNYYDGSEKIIWANVGNAQGAMVVLAFNKKGIFTILITPMGKIQGEVIIIESSEIDSVKFKKGLISYKLIITSSTSEIPTFRVNHVMIGYKEHKEELAILLNEYK